MRLLVISDLHLGVQRTGGTTAESATALRAYAQMMFKDLLRLGRNIAINGDMFDSYQVPTSDLLQAYITLVEWLREDGQRLYMIPGNHDLAKNSANLSSFELLSKLLVSQFPDKVSYHPGGSWVDENQGIYAISHVANQDLFDASLKAVPASAKYLLLHCNYDNAFAGQADHSLNLDRAVAKELTKNGLVIVMGHEHQHKTALNDKVVVVGNQFPTSVSDCLNNSKKYCLEIYGDDMELIPTWSANDKAGGFVEVDWYELLKADHYHPKFVRVTGKADANQSADVIRVVSKFRQLSKDYVVTNAVKVESVEGVELEDSVEDIRAVNVMDLLMEALDADQQAAVRKLLSGSTK